MSLTPDAPPTLNYRQPHPLPVSELRFGRASTLLILANTLLGAAMVLSIFFIDRLGLAGWLMIASGSLLIYITMGTLTIDTPKFKRAAVLATLAFPLAAASLVLNWNAARDLERLILSNATGSYVIVYFETGTGKQLTTLLLAWKICAAATLASAALLALIIARLYHLYRHRYPAI